MVFAGTCIRHVHISFQDAACRFALHIYIALHIVLVDEKGQESNCWSSFLVICDMLPKLESVFLHVADATGEVVLTSDL